MKYVIAVLSTLLLGACASLGQNGDPMPQITFDHVKAYPLYVASYEPVGLTENGIEDMPAGFAANPVKIIHDYLNSRFEAAGTQGKLIAQIKSAEVSHEIMKSKNSVSAFVGMDKKDHYRVTVVLALSARGVRGIEGQNQNLTVYRDIYVSEHATLVEREKIEMKAMDHMVDDLDIALRKVLHDQFGIFRPQAQVQNKYSPM